MQLLVVKINIFFNVKQFYFLIAVIFNKMIQANETFVYQVCFTYIIVLRTTK